MVQLSSSSPKAHGEPHLAKNAEDYKNPMDGNGSPRSLQASSSSTMSSLQAFENYLDNGLVTLKHKIRNIEKKKVKLEDYKERLNSGEALNQDQLEAVEKYEEVVHNLDFAKDLQKTFSVLNQDLLKAQKKALRRETLLKVEMEKKRLHTILQIQYMLQSYSQDHVLKDFKDGLNGAKCLSFKELDCLTKFSKLVCSTRHKHMSLEDQMDQLSTYFWNLLEGSEKTVAGTNYKYLKDLVARMLDCGYFESVPDPPRERKLEEPSLKELQKNDKVAKPEASRDQSANLSQTYETKSLMEYIRYDSKIHELPIVKSSAQKVSAVKEVQDPKPVQTNYTKLQGLKSWGQSADLKLQETKKWPTPQHLTPLAKPREAAVLVKDPPPAPKRSDPEPKEKRVRKAPSEIKLSVNNTPDLKVSPVVNGQTSLKRRDLPPAVQNGHGHLPSALSPTQSPLSSAEFGSSSLPKDPELRKKKLEILIDQIKGTYNFMQDSVLEFEYPSPRASPVLRLQSTPIAASELQQITRKDLPSPKKVPPRSPPPTRQTNEPAFQVFSEPETTEILEPDIQSPNCPDTPIPDDSFIGEEGSVLGTCVAEDLHERSLTPLTLQTEEIASPITPSKTHPIQLKPEGTPISSQNTSVRMSSSPCPFQGIQTVFKVHAPLPPNKEPELAEEPYSPEFHQTFSTVSTQTLPHCPLEISPGEQTFIQEPLAGSPYTSSGIHHVNSIPCYTTPNMLPRMPQPYVNRGSVRGTSRGRIMTNGIRYPPAYKGTESIRGAHCVTSGTYGPVPCAGRDYNSTQFISRDANAHLANKRGTAPRSSSRGWSESSQASSPERNEVFSSTDSGHGDSRSMTSDMSMCSQPTTLLPVHVYPLPQQMRVAFSTARTSNFAPGTLDQPIVFDLLLNNLGDSFDFQHGRFQCPVNGTYVFIFHMLKLAVNVPLYVNLMKNDEVLVSAYANDGAPDHETASNHAVLQLFQGDQLWLRLHRGAIYGSSWKYSTFSGYLLYQD